MGEFTEDKAVRALLLIGFFGVLFWSTYGHMMRLYEDSIVETHGELAWEDGVRHAHVHGMANTIAATLASIAVPLIGSLRRLKTFLAIVLGLSLVFWNLGYTYAGLTTAVPTEDAYEAAEAVAVNYFMIPLSWIASLAGGILFIALVHDLMRKRSTSA